jgi:hypothetical protein
MLMLMLMLMLTLMLILNNNGPTLTRLKCKQNMSHILKLHLELGIRPYPLTIVLEE